MKIIEGWTWKQAVVFVLVWCLVCGPWVYFAWSIK